jgi:hypothetical protein
MTPPKRRASRARDAQLGFEALSIEGCLLSPVWRSKVTQLAAEGQSEADYRIRKGLNLRDEIGRYWRIAQPCWQEFEAGLKSKADTRLLAERFIVELLRESFGFTSLVTVPPHVLAERNYPIGHAALDGRVPLVIAPAASGLDALSPAFGDGTRRRSAFGLAQEYLNTEDAALWGITSDGVNLRILRDNASLTRPAWIEADLRRIFTEERYADFAALWLLMHETRFGRADQPVTECSLEAWRNAGREEGTRAREQLRQGVEEAIKALGQGFLSHPDNQVLRTSLQNGDLTTKDLFNQLLRLVYRLIFLLTVEERELLHPNGTPDAVKTLYTQGYSLRRLRERSVKRSAHDRFSDLWEATKIVFRGTEKGEPKLGLPALAGIFAHSQCAALDASKLENRALLLAVWRLAWLRQDGSLARVNWRDMGPEELGSVYESLLELVPQITQDGRQFAFATGGETKGNARKTTGSYYTPDSLVQVLLDSALEPVIADTIARNPDKPLEALLALSIVDPACGSGHFLLAAARRLAAHVARLQANGTPSAAEYRHALRQVVGHCIYGVDLNPMAVELCKVSLWMEAVEPGLPLTFLNSHIQQGNALLGTTPELMVKGIPDTAWEPIEGDDKKIASSLKKKNKQGDRVEHDLFSRVPRGDTETQTVARAVADLDAAGDANAEALAKKESQWDGILSSAEYRHQKFVADSWCAAFVWPKLPGELADAAPTNELWRQIRDGVGTVPAATTKTANELTEQYSFFHWHLQFPQVFAKHGFDVVLGNPPWERVKLQEQEFFASRNSDVSGASNAAARKKLIVNLQDVNPQLWTEWCAASRKAAGESHTIRQSGRYPLCGKGDVNTYAIFAESNLQAIGPFGRAGFVVPSGIATDDTTKLFFSTLVRERKLVSLFDFQSGPGLFGDIGHARFKFCLLVLGTVTECAQLAFFIRCMSELSETSRRFTLSASDFEILNPNTKTCPTFRSLRDANINIALYRRSGILWRENDEAAGNPWGMHFMAMLHMANDSDLFRSRSELPDTGTSVADNGVVRRTGDFVPLIEAKMLHHFDHRYGDYSDKPPESENTSLPDVPVARLQNPAYCPLPRYWVSKAEVDRIVGHKWHHNWFLGWRDICRSFDERTVIVSLIPRVAVNHKFPIMLPAVEPRLVACLYALLSSHALDYSARQKLGGASLTYFIIKQLPVPSPIAFSKVTSWNGSADLLSWILPRVLELTYTAWDLEPFARDIGYAGSPFRWDPERRFVLRCELDAAFFHLYGLSKEDTAYVMDSFPIVRKNDEKTHGTFRTKDVILEIYGEMAEAARTGNPYQARLDPPPADPRVAHPPRDNNVISLRPTPAQVPSLVKPAPFPMPAVACAIPALVEDGSWKLVSKNLDTVALFALAAVVMAAGRPIASWQARMAALLTTHAKEAASVMTKDDAAVWKKAVGTDCSKKWDSSKLDAALEKAETQLRFQQFIELKDNQVVALPALSSDPPDDLYLGRADFILKHVIATLTDKSRGELKILFPLSLRDAPDHALQA